MHISQSVPCIAMSFERASSNIGEAYRCIPLFTRDIDDGNSSVNLKEPKWKRKQLEPDIKGIFFADFDRTIAMVTRANMHVHLIGTLLEPRHPAHTLQLHTFNIMHRRGIGPQNLTDDEVVAHS